MKRLVALLLSMIMLLAVFAGCGEEKKPAVEQPSEEPKGEEGRVFESPEIEALVVMAEAYLARKSYLQYDQARLIEGNVTPTTFRRDIHKNSPEDITRQFNCYTSCSGFTSDVYYQTFGFSYGADTTGALMNATDMHVWSYYVTKAETDEEKENIKNEFLSLLKAGDIMLCRHDSSSGHAMLYIGDGQIIHSAGPDGGSFNFANNTDRVEPKGSVASKTLDSIWQGGDNYYFFDEFFWAIVRPLQKFPDAELTEQAKNRVANMQGIMAEKVTSHPVGFTADKGEEITFTFHVKNSNKEEVNLEILDTVPSNATYVSGAETVDGNTLKWNITVPASSSKSYTYTVKVNDNAEYGDTVYSESTIGGVYVNCRKIYIGKNVSEEIGNKMISAAENLKNYTQTGMELAKQIYADAGMAIELDSAEEIVNGSFKAYVRNGQTYENYSELDPDSKYFKMVVPTMYGGYHTAISPEFEKLRTRGMQSVQLMAGDILVASLKGKVSSYLYVGGNRLVTLDGKVEFKTLAETKDILLSMMGYDKFVVVRPALAQ